MIYFSVLARLVSGLYQAPVWLGTDSHRHRRSQGTPLHLDSGCNTAVNFHNVHVFVLMLLLVEELQHSIILYFSAIYLQASYITIMMIARNLCWCWCNDTPEFPHWQDANKEDRDAGLSPSHPYQPRHPHTAPVHCTVWPHVPCYSWSQWYTF